MTRNPPAPLRENKNPAQREGPLRKCKKMHTDPKFLTHLGRSSFEADYPALENRLKAADTLAVYCTSRQCEDSSLVATRLSQSGYESVLVFEGGWAEWWKRHR